MKTYRNSDFGFEIDIPEQWPNPIILTPDSLVFDRTPRESLNFVIGPLAPERLLEYTEFEFRQYIQRQGYTDLKFGRIMVGDKNHIWARYSMGSGLWAKKYMIVFAGVEYSITATCYFSEMLRELETDWDKIVSSFRLSEEREKDVADLNLIRIQAAGELYATAYNYSSNGQYTEACALLNQCIEQEPNHILAHKELAFILKNTGDLEGALSHRLVVKRLDSTDKVNCFNLAGILAMLGKKDSALREIDELIKAEPYNQRFVEFRRMIVEKF